MSLALNKPKLDNLADDIWKSAERLRGKFKAYEYQNVVLPIIVIRRLECVLIEWREKKRAEVLAKRPKLTGRELKKLVKDLETSTAPFSNKSHWTLRRVYEEDHTLLERPYLRVGNVQDGHLDLDKLGRGYLWKGEIPGCLHQNHIFAVRCFLHKLKPMFLAYVTAAKYGRDYFEATGKKTTNLACTNATKVGEFPVPLPPLPEQEAICAHLDEKLGELKQIVTGIDACRGSTSSGLPSDAGDSRGADRNRLACSHRSDGPVAQFVGRSAGTLGDARARYGHTPSADHRGSPSMGKYRDLPMDLADAALVRIAEREKIRRVFTLDRRDFTLYRPIGIGRFTILPGR